MATQSKGSDIIILYLQKVDILSQRERKVLIDAIAVEMNPIITMEYKPVMKKPYGTDK
jgi:hypothetical protein